MRRQVFSQEAHARRGCGGLAVFRFGGGDGDLATSALRSRLDPGKMAQRYPRSASRSAAGGLAAGATTEAGARG